MSEGCQAINDGGAAFPTPRRDDSAREYSQWNGMTLRDYFAGQALVGIMYRVSYASPRSAAHEAYTFADAMLKEREAKQ